jgi:8-oxo-dGTP pyrophosphatase MutT (NUDIX family)
MKSMSSTALSQVKSDWLLSASDLPARLAAVLEGEGRWPCARPSGRMSPELSYGRHNGPAPSNARSAAVMLLLFQRDGRWHLPLTERPASLAHHGGQVCLPGGAIEPGETSAEAAIRELREELGSDAALEIVGRLSDCYVFASNFVVTPWLAATRLTPVWQPDAREVERVVEMPLTTLLDPASIGCTTIRRGPLAFRAPCYHIDDACIWGATSVILNELGDLLVSLHT